MGRQRWAGELGQTLSVSLGFADTVGVDQPCPVVLFVNGRKEKEKNGENTSSKQTKLQSFEVDDLLVPFMRKYSSRHNKLYVIIGLILNYVRVQFSCVVFSFNICKLK